MLLLLIHSTNNVHLPVQESIKPRPPDLRSIKKKWPSTEDRRFSFAGRCKFEPRIHHLLANHLTSPSLRSSSSYKLSRTNTYNIYQVPAMSQVGGAGNRTVNETASLLLELTF